MADVKAYSSLSPSSSSKHQDSNTNSAISTASILDRFSFDDAIFALVEEMRIKQPNAVAFCKVQVYSLFMTHNTSSFYLSVSIGESKSDI